MRKCSCTTALNYYLLHMITEETPGAKSKTVVVEQVLRQKYSEYSMMLKMRGFESCLSIRF